MPQANQIAQWTTKQINNPLWFIEYFFNCKLYDKQKEIANSVCEHRITAVRSCHDSGKSFISARIGVHFLQTNKDSKVIITAPSWTQVDQIIWNEIRSAYQTVKEVNPQFHFQGKLTGCNINISPDWFAIGLATKKEGEEGSVADRFIGFHARSGKILIIVDEGSGILPPIWGAIEALMTSANAKLLVLGNPYKLTGGFANFFKQKGVNKIHIADTDIPNIQQNRIIYPGLMSPHYPIEMIEKYGKDSNIYLIKVKGEFPRSETDTLISFDHLEAAFNRVVEPEGKKKLGVDVARYGNNFTAFVIRQGKKILKKEKYLKENTMQTTGRVLRIMDDEKIADEDVNIDDIGVGGGVVDRLQELGHNINGVNVGKEANDPERFYNLRAEAYWAIREWIKTASIPRDDDFYELTNLKYKWRSDRKGQLIMESKDEMSKRGLESPNVADALMLTLIEGNYSPFPNMTEEDNEEIGKPEGAGILTREF